MLNVDMNSYSSTAIGSKIIAFTDLKAWQESQKLLVCVYKLTGTFPKHEQYSLTSQMQRACVSITSNIAEGFRRNTWKDKANFYSIALGSINEIDNQLMAAKDIGYITKEIFDEAHEQAISASKLTKGLLKKTQSRI
jgi:four helix bundle protein